VHKAKVLKKPKFDLTKLMELYQENKGDDLPAAGPAPTNTMSTPAE